MIWDDKFLSFKSITHANYQSLRSSCNILIFYLKKRKNNCVIRKHYNFPEKKYGTNKLLSIIFVKLKKLESLIRRQYIQRNLSCENVLCPLNDLVLYGFLFVLCHVVQFIIYIYLSTRCYTHSCYIICILHTKIIFCT